MLLIFYILLVDYGFLNLLASEILGRKCATIDINPIYCEITLRRLENYRENNLLGWQNSNPFEKEILTDKKLKSYLNSKYKLNY